MAGEDILVTQLIQVGTKHIVQTKPNMRNGGVFDL